MTAAAGLCCRGAPPPPEFKFEWGETFSSGCQHFLEDKPSTRVKCSSEIYIEDFLYPTLCGFAVLCGDASLIATQIFEIKYPSAGAGIRGDDQQILA